MYHINCELSSFFSTLAVGNWWEYRPVGVDERYVIKDRFEVIDREENTYFISHYQYAYFTGSEEERRQLT